MKFIAQQHLHHDQFGFLVREEQGGRFLGGFGSNYYRPWVFPLYTPRGLTVIQEFPYDHPFHNGFWVAQGPVLFQGREVHFWPAPPERRPGEKLFAHMGRIESLGLPEVNTHAQGVGFRLRACWRDSEGNPVLDEERSVDFFGLEDATICEMRSTQRAAYGALEYAPTKFGSIGVRVEPRLTPDLGGEVITSEGQRGNADVAIDQRCSYVAYENRLGAGDHWGILLAPPHGEAAAPWFVRDYGLAFASPTRHESVTIGAGESWNVGLRAVAYDGPLTAERAQRWLSL
jgi:hypothetical protein